MRKALGKTLMIGAGVGVAVAVLGRETAPGKALRRGVDVLGRRVRYAGGRLEGLSYRLAGRRPDPRSPTMCSPIGFARALAASRSASMSRGSM